MQPIFRQQNFLCAACGQSVTVKRTVKTPQALKLPLPSPEGWADVPVLKQEKTTGIIFTAVVPVCSEPCLQRFVKSDLDPRFTAILDAFKAFTKDPTDPTRMPVVNVLRAATGVQLKCTCTLMGGRDGNCPVGVQVGNHPIGSSLGSHGELITEATEVTTNLPVSVKE